MESYDAWSLEPEYTNLHLTDRVKALGQQGFHVHGFISSGIGTIQSLGVFITGLPFARVLVNYQPIVREGVPTASAKVFKRLGYRTRFFYGGFLSWQRVGQFCREQGFDEVYGGDQMRTVHPALCRGERNEISLGVDGDHIRGMWRLIYRLAAMTDSCIAADFSCS